MTTQSKIIALCFFICTLCFVCATGSHALANELSPEEEFSTLQLGESDEDSDLQEILDQDEQSNLLPQFFFGLAKRKLPLAPPAQGTLSLWSYRFDLALGYVFCRSCNFNLYTGVNGSLSYPIRLSNDIGRPIQQAGAKALARIYFAEHEDNLASLRLKSIFITGMTVEVSQIQYSRYSLWSFLPSLEAGLQLTTHTAEDSFLGSQAFMAQLMAGAAGFFGEYSTSEAKPLERSDLANDEQLRSTIDWRGRGSAKGWEVTSLFTWSPFYKLSTEDPVIADAEAKPTHAVGVSVAYRELIYNKLLLQEAASKHVTQQEWVFQLVWQKQLNN